jgi:hypothetical protein
VTQFAASLLEADPVEKMMSRIGRRQTSGLSPVCGAAALAVGALLVFAPDARAQDGAARILKAMSDYVSSQKSITATYDSDIEVVTPELQKLQFNSSGQISLTRPDNLRATRTGGYVDVEFVFDGKTFTVHDRDNKAYAQADASGSIDQLVERLRSDFSVEAPGADLLLTASYDRLTEDVVDGKHIGIGVVNGVECEHLAFRGVDSDWQIWVEIGNRPIPRKYVITNKAITGAPQYTVRIRDWQTDAQAAPDAFAFKPPAGASKVDVKALAQIDEVPHGVAHGEKK